MASLLTSADVDVFSDFEQLREVGGQGRVGTGQGGVLMANNCRRIWPLVFGREIDLRAEIVAVAWGFERVNCGYARHLNVLAERPGGAL